MAKNVIFPFMLLASMVVSSKEDQQVLRGGVPRRRASYAADRLRAIVAVWPSGPIAQPKRFAGVIRRGECRPDMGVILDFQERRRLLVANRCLKKGDECIVRQLHAISLLDLHSAELTLAASVLKTMLVSHELMLEHHRLVADVAGKQAKAGPQFRAVQP
jgi:hypothetical protein